MTRDAAKTVFCTGLQLHDEGDYVSLTCHGPEGSQALIVGMPSSVWRRFVRDMSSYWLVPEGVGSRPKLM
ncbi:MAG: hypothetical protein KF723_22410 [Rhizobiaceae bacterium]|nr:hypothetical protein [Rhizobiaceae bacterium]